MVSDFAIVFCWQNNTKDYVEKTVSRVLFYRDNLVLLKKL